MSQQIQMLDTTLRDGSQGEKVSFSVLDKLLIAKKLDEFGIHYIEGGWPNSNPKDMLFFEEAAKHTFKHAKLVSFGSTRRAGKTVETDENIQALVQAKTPVVSLFGKTWLLHAKKALNITPEENLKLIADSVHYLKSQGKEVIFDAEHFFDGFKDNKDYALKTLQVAKEAGADVLVLCDTNGGTLTLELVEIIKEVQKHVPAALGIHAHNDCGMAVSNSVAAVQAGCVHVQGTINGFGERCGNANLVMIIPDLQLKLAYACVPDENLRHLVNLSRYVYELANINPADNDPYVGKSAFAHKGGVHVSAVMKDPRTYEHIDPVLVGNRRRILVSDLSGQSNVVYKAGELGIDLKGDKELTKRIIRKLKQMEHDGYQFEGAEASFELLVRSTKGESNSFFRLEGFRVIIEKDVDGEQRSEATIRLWVNGHLEHTAADGDGPVNALDNALRKALERSYPDVKQMKLTDYKVRVIDSQRATEAKVRVLIESRGGEEVWGTVGVSENIIEASWQALTDSVWYYLFRNVSE